MMAARGVDNFLEDIPTTYKNNFNSAIEVFEKGQEDDAA